MNKTNLLLSTLPSILTSLVIITALMMQDKLSTNYSLLLMFIVVLVAFVPIIVDYLIYTRNSNQITQKVKQQPQITQPPPPPQIPRYQMQQQQARPPPPQPTTTYQFEDEEDYVFMKNAGFIK